MKKKKPSRQKYKVRFFIAKTFDVFVQSHTLENARLQARIKLHEGRGKGFKQGSELIVIESWTDLASQALKESGLTNVGNLDHPLFIVPGASSRS